MSNKKPNPEIESRKPLEFPATMENPPFSGEQEKSKTREALLQKMVVRISGSYGHRYPWGRHRELQKPF